MLSECKGRVRGWREFEREMGDSKGMCDKEEWSNGRKHLISYTHTHIHSITTAPPHRSIRKSTNTLFLTFQIYHVLVAFSAPHLHELTLRAEPCLLHPLDSHPSVMDAQALIKEIQGRAGEGKEG